MKGCSSHEDVSRPGGDHRRSYEPHQGISSNNLVHRRARVAGAAARIDYAASTQLDLAGGYALRADLRALGAPDGAVPVPNTGGGAREGCSSGDDGGRE